MSKKKKRKKNGNQDQAMGKPQLTNMDLHCIARMMQNSFQAPDEDDIQTSRCFYGCMYCKYAFECCPPGHPTFHFREAFAKLRILTGVSVGSYKPENDREAIGSVFFPGSYYIDHPEILNELERIHPKRMMGGFKASLDKVIAHSKEKPD